MLHGAMLSHALLLVALVTAPIEAWERLSARRNRVVTATAEGSNSGASNWKAWVGYTLLGAGVACALVLMSYSHPFLLSDNRWGRTFLYEYVNSALT